MEGTNLTAEEQAQAAAEFAELSGTIDNSAAEETVTTDNFSEEESQETEEGSEETEAKESKTEKKIKKLLSKKNQAEKKVETLEEKVERLEQESKLNKFKADYPDSRDHIDLINNLLEEKPHLTMEDAYLQLVGRGDIQLRSHTKGFVGRPNSGLSAPKDPRKGTTAEMESYLKDNFSDLRI